MLEFHPLANLFPLIEGREFDELVADVKANRIVEPLMFLDMKVLDGRNRYRAAIAAGLIEDWVKLGDLPKFSVPVAFYDADQQGDPLDWVLSKNLHRRHLTESQRSIIAADLGKLRQGRPSEWNRNPDNPASLRDFGMTAQQRADALGISERQVQTGDFVKAHAAPDLIESVRKGDVKVSAAAELAKLDEAEQLEVLRTVPPRLIARAARERQQVGAGARSVMASRVEPPDSLDYFPTPPWATRALIEDVLCADIDAIVGRYPGTSTVWEPACGEGHISGVLEEYFSDVVATDIFDYSVDGISAAGWQGRLDFLDPDQSVGKDLVEGSDVSWIISNAPFTGEDGLDRTLAFALRALQLVPCVAMFVRSQWAAEGLERYARLFSEHPPTIVAHFAERVNLRKGYWDPNGDTATAYTWLVWVRDAERRPTMWIKPGRRTQRTRETDAVRFTAHPIPALSRDEQHSLDAPADESDVQVPRSVAAPEGGEGAAAASDALPASLDANELIRQGYAEVPFPGLEMLATRTGLSPNAVQQRAKRMKLGDPARQAAAVAEANRRRAQLPAGEAAHG